MSVKSLPSSVRSSIIQFLDDPSESHQTLSNPEVGYAITATKLGGEEIRLSCPEHWKVDFLEYFDVGKDMIQVGGPGITAHKEVIRESMRTDLGGMLRKREKFALLDESDRVILSSGAEHLRSLVLSIALARIDVGRKVVLYSTFPSSVVSMDLMEAAQGLGVRFNKLDHAPLRVETDNGTLKVVEVPNTTTQQTPACGQGKQGDVLVYLDAGHQSFKQVKDTAVPAMMTEEVEVVAGTARELAHNRPPTGVQAALSIADEPRVYHFHK